MTGTRRGISNCYVMHGSLRSNASASDSLIYQFFFGCRAYIHLT